MKAFNPRPWGRLILLLTGACLGSPAEAQDVKLDNHPTRWRFEGAYFEVENGNARGDDGVGLLGVHFDVLEPFTSVPELYLGLGGFAAATGERGGLFIGGITTGWLQPLNTTWAVDAGLFVGGGGGGDGPISEGFVARPHLALERSLGFGALRLELAHIDVKDDPIDDFHVALGVSLPSEVLRASESGRRDAIPEVAVVPRKLRITPLVQVIDTDEDTEQSTGPTPFRNNITLIGIGVDYFVGEHTFVPFEAYGAVGGDAAGYASAYTGLGWSLPFAGEAVTLELAGLVGAAGGGKIDVGGGFSWQARGGLRARLWGPVSAVLTGGYIDAPDGTFQGASVTGGLSWTTVTPNLRYSYPRSRLEVEGLPEARARVVTTRVQLLNKTYVPRPAARSTSGKPHDRTINLLGLGFEQPIWGDFSIMGRAYTAWEGDIGGYGEGLFGLKYEFAPLIDERHHFSISMEAGAGGGGGVDVDSGLIWQFTSGWRYELSPHLSISAEIGHMEPNHGSFEAGSYQLGLTWNLGRAELR